MTTEDDKKEEEQREEKKIPYVNENCIWCGACVAICDKVFDMDDEGKAFAKEWETSDCVDDAIAACPVDAIHYKD